MRKIKEVLRLRFELGLGQREIARACSISQGAVHNYLKKAAGAGMQWPLPEGWDEKQIEEAVFGKQRSIEESCQRSFPDFPALHNQLQQHAHLTLQLAWEEYREKNPEGYRYSWFCELYRQWRGKQDVVLRQEHKAGEKGFVDWAGATMPVQDPDTGTTWQASLFVMVLGASSYTYAEATRDQQLSAWISSHIHAFEYFGGVPRLLVPDNPRTGVSRACRYDPDVTGSSDGRSFAVRDSRSRDHDFRFELPRISRSAAEPGRNWHLVGCLSCNAVARQPETAVSNHHFERRPKGRCCGIRTLRLYGWDRSCRFGRERYLG